LPVFYSGGVLYPLLNDAYVFFPLGGMILDSFLEKRTVAVPTGRGITELRAFLLFASVEAGFTYNQPLRMH